MEEKQKMQMMPKEKHAQYLSDFLGSVKSRIDRERKDVAQILFPYIKDSLNVVAEIHADVADTYAAKFRKQGLILE